MQRLPVELCIFQDAKGRQPFADWLARLQTGNPGDCRALGSGLMQLRIDTGPGYRVYFARMPVGQCLILSGGSKRTQVADIERAKTWLEDARRLQSR